MGILNRLKKRSTTVTAAEGTVRLNDLLVQILLGTDAVVTESQAMNVPSFAACVNHIANTISMIPIYLYKKDEKGVTKLEDDVRVKLINEDTKDTLTGTDFKRALVYDYLTDKGGYAFINKSGNKYVSLHYVDADKITFVSNNDPVFKDYKIVVDGHEYEPHQFIKCVRRTKDGHKGTPIIAENSQVLSVAYNALKYELKQVKKGGVKKGFLESEHKLSDDAVTALREGFNRLYGDDSENTVILNNGVQFKEASATALELQLNENKKANGNEICKIFNIPPAIITGGATEKDMQEYIQYCIIPHLEVICKALNRDLLLEKEKKDHYYGPDLHELTKGDIKSRYEAYNIGYKAGFIQIDEIRKEENLPAMNIPFIKLGLQDVLYDPSTGKIFLPNMNKWANLRDESTEGEENKEEIDGASTGQQDNPPVNDTPDEDEIPREEGEDEDSSKS